MQHFPPFLPAEFIITILSPPGPDSKSQMCSKYSTATYLRGEKTLLCFFQNLTLIWPQDYMRHYNPTNVFITAWK